MPYKGQGKAMAGKTWYIQEVRKDSEKDKINENMYLHM
jgi:hypothetical protein